MTKIIKAKPDCRAPIKILHEIVPRKITSKLRRRKFFFQFLKETF